MSKIFLSFIISFIFLVNVKAQTSSLISGPTQILPETNVIYTYTVPGANIAYSYPWTCNSTNVTLFQSGTSVTLKVSNAETAATITLHGKQDYVIPGSPGDVATSESDLVITILPRITVQPIYPGETITFGINDNSNHTGCTYNWNVSPSVICPSCGASSSNSQSIYISPNLNPMPSAITVNCTISGCSPSLSSTALTPQGLLVKLRNPTITGLSSVGCVGSPPIGNFVYTATMEYGATNYNWVVPSFLTILSGQGTNQITVVENNIGGPANILLQTSNNTNSAVHSDVVSFQVQVCCRSQYNITNNVTTSNSPDKQQSAIKLIANNIVNIGTSAMYHAASQVNLKPGFTAISGSYFHGYLEGCSGIYYRQGNTNASDSLMPIESSEINLPSLSNFQIDAKISNSQKTYDFSVFPNPNNGSFKLIINNDSELPKSVIIRDSQGREIKSIQNPTQHEYNFNLNELNNGLYIINCFYNDKAISKKFIKN